METFNPHLQPLRVSFKALNPAKYSAYQQFGGFRGDGFVVLWMLAYEKATIMERTKEFKYQEMKLGNCSQLQRSNTFRSSGGRKLAGEWAATKVKAS